MSIELTQIDIPAVAAARKWQGGSTFTLQAGDTLKIESDAVEHLNYEVPEGETRTFTINITIDD